jgi:hypothetical protein
MSQTQADREPPARLMSEPEARGPEESNGRFSIAMHQWVGEKVPVHRFKKDKRRMPSPTPRPSQEAARREFANVHEEVAWMPETPTLEGNPREDLVFATAVRERKSGKVGRMAKVLVPSASEASHGAGKRGKDFTHRAEGRRARPGGVLGLHAAAIPRESPRHLPREERVK